MGDFDPCECVWNHENAMRRLINMVRNLSWCLLYCMLACCRFDSESHVIFQTFLVSPHILLPLSDVGVMTVPYMCVNMFVMKRLWPFVSCLK